MKLITPDWPAPAHIKAYTTLRDSFGSDVLTNNNFGVQLKKHFDLREEPIWIKQVHGNRALSATLEHHGEDADALFTSATNRVCAVRTADCLPILLTNQQGTIVAAIHAGWRGLAGGVLESTLRAIVTPVKDILVWLGPAIGPTQFEVGSDVYQQFTKQSALYCAAFTKTEPNKWHANLYELARLRLTILGVNHIYGGIYCTYTQDDLFFSYRRDKTNPGRMASLIWINDKII